MGFRLEDSRPPHPSLCASFLRLYLLWQSRTSGEHRSIANYCLKCLERVLCNGGRQCTPSEVEAEAILARDPGNFSHPMSVPVFLSNDNHFLAGIDASCTFDEMTESVRVARVGGAPFARLAPPFLNRRRCFAFAASGVHGPRCPRARSKRVGLNGALLCPSVYNRAAACSRVSPLG